jgi:uncharacterized protein
MRKSPIPLGKKKLSELCRHNDIVYLGVFGSFARGEVRPSSDVDLLASFSQAKSLIDLVRIEREFSQAIGRKADLLTEASISPYLRDRILKETVVVYEES